MGQFIGQSLKRGEQHARQPIHVDRRNRLYRHFEPDLQVVHRQGNRIVGPLLALQHRPAVPGASLPGGPVRGAATAVVEQGGKQRRAARQGAAALRQCQACMLMAQ
ncbi:hypothetical protein D3C71_1305020 [compost metagenome]